MRSFLKADRVFSLGVYNAYNRMNPFFLFWDKGSSTDDAVGKETCGWQVNLSDVEVRPQAGESGRGCSECKQGSEFGLRVDPGDPCEMFGVSLN